MVIKMRKFVDFMWRLKENGFFDSATQVLYYCYIWVTLLLCIIYMIDYILARQGKKTQPSMFVDKDMNNIRENQLAPLYRGVASVSAVNLLIAEGLRHLLLGLGLEFPYIILYPCVAIAGVFYFINLVVFCRHERVLPKFIVGLIYK